MKVITRGTLIMRIAGTILLCLAVLLSGYASIISAPAWKEVTTKLAEVGAVPGSMDRLMFTTDYFHALSRAASDKSGGSAARAAGISGYFASYAARYDKALAAQDAQSAEAVYAYYLTEFNFPSFLERYSLREDNAEQLAIDKIYDSFESLAAPPAIKGKKLPAIKSAGQAESLFPGYYESFAAGRGQEEVGTYYEYLQAVQRMLDEYTADHTVTSAKNYMETVFTQEAYAKSLQAVRTNEKVAENNSFLKSFAEMVAAQTEGAISRETLAAFFEKEYGHVLSQYPGAAYGVFLNSVKTLINSGVAFDGSYKAVVSAVKSAMSAREASSFAAFLQSFARGLVEEADKRAAVYAVEVLWKATAGQFYFWGAGILLVILAAVLKKTLSASFMRKLEIQWQPDDPDVLLRVSHLKQYFKSGTYVNKAVDDVSFFIKKGEVFGLVGESGCGKTTTGRTIINLYDPTEGDVYFQGLRISSTMNGAPVLHYQERAELEAKLTAMTAEKEAKIKESPAEKDRLQAEYAAREADMKKAFAARAEQIQRRAYESAEEKRRSQQLYREKRMARLTEEYQRDAAALEGEAAQERKRRYETEMDVAGRDNMMTKMQMIFQDPIASINPRMTVREIIAEGLRIRGIKDKKYIDDKVYEMLELVGLVPEHADRYPHEFSGGQRQRIGIARAIVLEPELIIADEPISALDVSIQAQVINLLNELRNKMGLTILFIAHNLSVVKYFSDRIAVMYFGRIVEMTTSDELFQHPLHPYTKSLLSAIPYPDPHYEKTRKRIEYNPTLAHDYTTDKPAMHEIVPGHFIHCNQAELHEYRRELGL